MAQELPPWSVPPPRLRLRPDEVHVWRVFLDDHVPDLDRLQQTLAEDERARADRFRFPKHRNRFVVRRGALRIALANYLMIQPGQLSFSYGTHGKPALAERHGAAQLKFNLSDSKGLALLAVTRSRELGIDVEHIHRGPVNEKLARRFFAAGEAENLSAVPKLRRREAFFNCWTRKEAYLKARGEGLSAPLDGFEVSLSPGQPAALLRTREGPQETARWSLQELAPALDYVACLAVEGSGWRLKCWTWL